MADVESTKAADLPRDIYVMYKKKFDNFDINKDGIISVAEFTSVSKVFGYSLTDDDIRVRLLTYHVYMLAARICLTTNLHLCQKGGLHIDE